MNILENSENGFNGRFIIYKYDENTIYKKIKKEIHSQKLLLDKIKKNFSKYKNIIENIYKSPFFPSIKGYDVEDDGSYKCKIIHGYRLDRIANLNLKNNEIIKIRIAILKLKSILNKNVNKLSGDWALHNLIYSINDDKIYNVDLEGFFSYPVVPHWGNINFINKWLDDCLKKIEYLIKSNSIMEDLKIINNHRPSEIHTIIVWDSKNKVSTDNCIKNFPKNIKILHKTLVNLTKFQQEKLALSIYTSKRDNRVINNTILIIIIEDTNPIYSFEKATSCWQVLNKNMKIIKEDMRLKVGGSKKNTRSVHTSYNQEEALFVLKPLKYDHYVKRITFDDFKHFFDHLNKHTKLKYLVQKSFHEIEYGPKFFHKNKDIDVLVNDYYYFKALTGARSVNRINMRENDNGYNVQSWINIGGVEIAFDIRFVGDDFIDSNWELDMLNRRIPHTFKQNININIPCIMDELYYLVYSIIIQKPNPHQSKHIPRVKQLLKESKINEVLDFNNIKSIRKFLDKFIYKNGYQYKKPFDKGVGFRI
jgi:hypothetical protein